MSAARYLAFLVENTALNLLAVQDMRNGRLERQIAALLDDRALATRLCRVRNDFLDLRHREEALGVRNLNRFAIDDPIADHLLGAAEIDLRKLVMHLGDVVVDRPIFVHENAEGHALCPALAF